jgi:hypothetical protein
MTISFDTDGAPGREGLLVTIRPRSPNNVVTVKYRVNSGEPNTIRGHEISRPAAADDQVFRVVFPPISGGALVDYLPICQNAGRQVPPATVRDFPASFRVPTAPAGAPVPRAADADPTAAKHPFSTEYLMTVSAIVRKPEVIVETSEGLRVSWFLESGTFRGPKLRGTIREAVDLMVVRRDGIGVMGVHAALETHDGALIASNYTGTFELGEDGYQNFLAGKYPPTPEARGAPLYYTTDPRYAWMNRLQCFLAGVVYMDKLNFVYDSYALH